MALKALLLRKKLDTARAALEELRAKDQELQTREAELEAAIGEAVTEEDKQAVEGLVSEFEAEKKEHEEKKTGLTGQVEQLEKDLAEEEAKQVPPPASAWEPGPANNPSPTAGERKDEKIVSMDERGLLDMGRKRRSRSQVRAAVRGFAQRSPEMLDREDVKDFLQRVRVLGTEKRAVNNTELTIPVVMLPLIREVMYNYSKLLPRVNLQQVPGTARQNIMGFIPEAVWTEACATLNELDFGFSQIEVDGYKVGGFIPVCNATLEDSDVDLFSTITEVLGWSIAKAADKSIVYGTDVKMPMGFVTRLAQVSKPSDWNKNAPEWKGLSATNLLSISGKEGKALFKEIALKAGLVRTPYSDSNITWLMNELTKSQLVAEGVEYNSSAAIVSGINGTMPVVGGDIVTLDFIPDGDIAFGHLDLYLMAERAGVSIAMSEHARFVADQTLFKGTARYDGMPVFGEAFAVININGKAPTTSVTFPPDKANEESSDVGTP